MLFQFLARRFAEGKRRFNIATANHQRTTTAKEVVMLWKQVIGDEISTAFVTDEPYFAFVDVVLAIDILN